jgi:hypothetical protein
MVIVDVASSLLAGVATYSDMGGPENINHEQPVFTVCARDLCQFDKEEKQSCL